MSFGSNLKGFWKEKSREELSNVVKVSKKRAKSCTILTAKSAGIWFENCSSLILVQSVMFLFSKKRTYVRSSQNEVKRLEGFFATFF